jgi:putative transposase
MRQIRSYKYKLYNNSDKNDVLQKDIELYSEVYNHCVALYNRFYKIYKKNINKYALQKHITKIKGRFKGLWMQLGSQAIQDITDRLDKSYKLFFGNLKRKVRTSPPSFKSRFKYKSFTLKQAGYKLDQNVNEITINKRKYKYFNSRIFDGDIKTLTVKRNHKGEIYVIFSVEQEMKIKRGFETGKIAGFDFGLGKFLVESEGREFISPQYLANSFEKLVSLSKRLSKKKKGSNNRKKAKLQLISLHEKVCNQRNDWQWKMALELVRSYDVICLESLSFLSMQKDDSLKTKQQKHGRARKILDLSPGSFIEKVKYKADEYGKKVLFVSRWFPSTRMCSNCSHVVEKMPQSVRFWVCPECGAEHDRDHNAAKNILREGTSSLGKGCEFVDRNVYEPLPF